MDSLSGLTDIYSQYSDLYNEKNVSGTKLKNTLENTDYANSTDDEIMDACKQFEAYFVEQVFKAMEKMVPKSEDSEGDYMKYFGDTLYQEYAKSATEQGDGFGIAKSLYEQMKRNYQSTIPSVNDTDAVEESGEIAAEITEDNSDI